MKNENNDKNINLINNIDNTMIYVAKKGIENPEMADAALAIFKALEKMKAEKLVESKQQ